MNSVNYLICLNRKLRQEDSYRLSAVSKVCYHTAGNIAEHLAARCTRKCAATNLSDKWSILKGGFTERVQADFLVRFKPGKDLQEDRKDASKPWLILRSVLLTRTLLMGKSLDILLLFLTCD